MIRFVLTACTATSLLLTPPAVQAQSFAAGAVAALGAAESTPPVPAATAPRAVPDSLQERASPLPVASVVALRARTASTLAPAPRLPRADSGPNRALIIVGAVGIAVGAVVGDDAGTIIMLGSAGLGLLGLYRLLR